MTFKLYPDQAQVMAELKAAMKKSKAILLQSPTGSGKTAMATDMVMRTVGKNNKILFSVPRKELLNQTSNTFASHKIPHGFVAAGKKFNPFSSVYIGMVETMARRIEELPKVKLVILDECHFGAEALGKVINHYKESGAWVVGLSATPWKMNGQGLGLWFDKMVEGKSIRWLIDNKRLSDYRYFYGRTNEDFSSLIKKTDKEIIEHMESRRVIIGDCVADYRKRCMGRLHIVRCTSIKHSQMTAEAFRNDGIPAVHVDGKTPAVEKDRIFKAFARREILVLTFADLLNFGFDLAQASGVDACVESCSDLKPSKSLAGQMQFWGRVLRYKPDAAIINDHVNNYMEHGLPCADREWTLDSKRKREAEKIPPSKQCPKCYYVHNPAPKCPECGHVYVVASSSGLKSVAGELHEMDIAAERAKLCKLGEPFIEGYTGTWQETRDKTLGKIITDEQTLGYLIEYAKKRKYKNPTSWAAKQLAKKMNTKYV